MRWPIDAAPRSEIGGVTFALERAPVHAILLDLERRPVWANEAMRELVRSQDGPPVEVTALPDLFAVIEGSETADGRVTVEVVTEAALFRIDDAVREVLDDGCELITFALAPKGPASDAERRLDLLLEGTSDIITVIDAEGRIRFSNGAGRRLTGISGTEANGRNAIDLVHPDDQERALIALEDALLRRHGGEPVDLRIQYADGTWHHVEVLITDRLDEPSIAGLVLTIRDVSHRVAEAKELVRRERLMSSLVEHLRDVVVVLDADLKVSFASPGIENIIDAPATTNLGESAFNDIHPDDTTRLVDEIARLTARPGAMLRTQLRLYHRRKGWRAIDATLVNCLEDPAVEGLVCTLRDVSDDPADTTERRLLDEAYARREADRRKDEFLATVSHEMRTPLTAIGGFADVLKRDLDDLDPDVRDHLLVRISENAEDLRDMVDRMLAVAQLDDGEVALRTEPVEVRALLRGTADALGDLLAHHRLELEVDTAVGHVLGDEMALRHVLRNLLSNATKFAPRGSTITVAAAVSGGEVRFSVRDRGPGIPPSEQARIFDRFFQIADAIPAGRRGVGVGLTIARRYVQLHRGRMWVESHPGHGATFSFTIPTA